MTVKGGTSPACAACKYQRRKCSSDCVLAPYFPANQHKSFQNAHRLFGVSKIVKILEQLSTLEQQEEAMKSIKYESDMRERYPVHGCAGIVHHLREQLRLATEELHYVYAQLAAHREQIPNNQQQLGCSSSDYSSSHQPQLLHSGVMINNSCSTTQSIDALPFFQHHYAGSMHDCEMPFTMDYFLANENYGDDTDANDDKGVRHRDSNDHVAKPLLGLEPVYTNTPPDPYCDLIRNNVNSVVGNQPEVIANSNQAFGIQPEIKVFDQDYEDMPPFNAMVDDRQSYVETKEACESSSVESSFRDFPQPAEQESGMESELRTAAACFSLTSVN
ncbi:LOB domain-containing protein 27-like [Coffea arabica]|uniref:LOB domain-containing protein 27-like n=1 Tax=Coffea arabica TaxID=13443 RepID=A0A6P6X602_COFAR|nr:LOB domain-containing protein 27-like [Coffea arabica]